MKKITLLLLLFSLSLFAELNMNSINDVLLNIYSKKELKYYNGAKLDSIDKSIEFTTLDDADILLFPQLLKMQTIANKISIVDSYQELKRNKNSIGAIYLKKNRTQIIFIRERLEDKGLDLPKKFNKYIVSSCFINSTCL